MQIQLVHQKQENQVLDQLESAWCSPGLNIKTEVSDQPIHQKQDHQQVLDQLESAWCSPSLNLKTEV